MSQNKPFSLKMLFWDSFINGTEKKPRQVQRSFSGNVCRVTVEPVYTTRSHCHGIEWTHLTLSCMQLLTCETKHTKARRSAWTGREFCIHFYHLLLEETHLSPLSAVSQFSPFLSAEMEPQGLSSQPTHIFSLLTLPLITASEGFVSSALMQASGEPSGWEEGML